MRLPLLPPLLQRRRAPLRREALVVCLVRGIERGCLFSAARVLGGLRPLRAASFSGLRGRTEHLGTAAHDAAHDRAENGVLGHSLGDGASRPDVREGGFDKRLRRFLEQAFLHHADRDVPRERPSDVRVLRGPDKDHVRVGHAQALRQRGRVTSDGRAHGADRGSEHCLLRLQAPVVVPFRHRLGSDTRHPEPFSDGRSGRCRACKRTPRPRPAHHQRDRFDNRLGNQPRRR